MAQLPCIGLPMAPLQIATFWEWLAIHFHFTVVVVVGDSWCIFISWDRIESIKHQEIQVQGMG